MKSMIACLVFLFLLVVMPMKAQYVVKPGDNLWEIAERNLNAASAWETIYNANPFLQNRGITIDKKGKKIVKILPGEMLQGVTKEGIVEYIPETHEPEALSKQSVVEYDYSWLFWVFLGMGLLLVGIWFYKKNPTEWRPMVAGGVKNEEDALIILNEQAEDSGRTLVFGSQRRVRLSGFWGTQHHGIPLPIPHRYNQEKSWVARFRNNDGLEEAGYMLQGCGNDVHAGAWYIPFPGATVTEGWGEEVEDILTTTQTVPNSTEEPESTNNQLELIQTEAQAVRIELRRAGNDQPAMIKLTGVDEKSDATIDLKKGEITVRFTPIGKN